MTNIFKSARIKLTLFYMLILVALSLVVTTSVRVLSEREYLRSNQVQRGVVLRLPDWASPDGYTDQYIDLQEAQQDFVRKRLNQEFILINAAALAVAGVLSYWFAGRTLKPIEEAHEAQTRFAADASHELRTPLTNLRLENEVFLRQKNFTEDEARELIVSNLEEVQRLEALSGDLLALTQYGNAQLALKSVAVKAIAGEATKLAAKTARARKVGINLELAQAKVTGHHDSLVQLLGILIDNAIKYGPVGSTVTIGGGKNDSHYLLWVQDEGPGIPPVDLPHIFDRLYRGDKARSSKVSGFGLGLSLAKAIAVANNAELSVKNTKPGARFTLKVGLV